MSPNGQPPPGAGGLSVGSFALADRDRFPTHHHDTHQLAWASSGILSMGVDDRTWVLPRARGLWIPAGTPHDVLADGDTTMVGLYFAPTDCPVAFSAPTVIDTSGLLGHLLDHLAGGLDPQARSRAEAVVFDLLVPVPTATIELGMPTDLRLRHIAEALHADPADPRTLAQWGRLVGASSRTLARVIQGDTGMTFATWRTRLRIAAALPRLAAGGPVNRVAHDVGYATPSAFVAPFRRTTGTTPGRYFADPSD
ncbi:MAG: helix-turn-helix transcriptional regulator [Acidimicrobiales bacterium]|nr:helix-turn-helix transcriptional regulator [Acidimicrobiales bacterium]